MHCAIYIKYSTLCSGSKAHFWLYYVIQSETLMSKILNIRVSLCINILNTTHCRSYQINFNCQIITDNVMANMSIVTISLCDKVQLTLNY